jgi:RNA polymerase sigma-70 factor (ECF subfamily)
MTGLMGLMEKRKALDQFLLSVQRRAFHMARIATGSDDDALDIVQDSMMKLVQKYGENNEDEWKPLFFRILQSRIYDFHRRHTVKQKIFSWFGLSKNDDGEEEDPIQTAPDLREVTPEKKLQLSQATDQLTQAVSQLPLRQQQAFLMRMWEGMSTAETARAMDVTEGSVKTHYSRALSALRNQLEGHW